jgi:uncharacterized protein YbjT (DUF2867 family)
MKVVIYGATGMVGQGILLECIEDPRVTSVICVGRKPTGVSHAKVRDLVRENLLDYANIGDAFKGVDACFYSLGVTSVGTDEPTYTRITHDFTVAAAKALAAANPAMTFCFVSGSGTDTNGRQMWARVKGRTEDAVRAMSFKTYCFRPGIIQPMKGVKSQTGWYNFFYAITAPLLPLLRPILGNYLTTTEHVGRAMIRIAIEKSGPPYLENADINRVGART